MTCSLFLCIVYISFRQMPRTGFLFYDGPVFVENVWFNSFEHGQVYKMGALGFNRNNEFGSSPVNSVKNVLFGFADSVSKCHLQ